MKEVKRLFDIPYYQLERHPNERTFSTKRNGEWDKVSIQSFLEKVNQVSKGLVALGIKPGDRVGVVSSNRYEWNTVDIAIQQVGGIVVPVYPNISIIDYKYIFKDAGIKICFVGNKELYDKINKNLNPIPNYKSILDKCKIIIENSKSIYKKNDFSFWYRFSLLWSC